MTVVLAAVGADVALAFVEIGLLALVLAFLARVASRLGITAVPFYLLAGLGLGEGGIADIGVAEDLVLGEIPMVGDVGEILMAHDDQQVEIGLIAILRLIDPVVAGIAAK